MCLAQPKSVKDTLFYLRNVYSTINCLTEMKDFGSFVCVTWAFFSMNIYLKLLFMYLIKSYVHSFLLEGSFSCTIIGDITLTLRKSAVAVVLNSFVFYRNRTQIKRCSGPLLNLFQNFP